MSKTRLLITGAAGFVGSALCDEAVARGCPVRAVVRTGAQGKCPGCEIAEVPDVASDVDWAPLLREVDVVIHLAARVHVMHEKAANPLEEFRRTNLHGTVSLARQAAHAGVRRLVFVSSIKVNGEQTPEGRTFSSSDNAEPQDAYAVSKWEAEQALRQISRETGLEVVIVRPPLIYGPMVRGNFFRLMQLVDMGAPLPFASIRNLRSMLYLGNFVDALLLVAAHPAAAGRTWLLRDGEDISTPDLMRLLAEGMEKKARLFPLPPGLLRGVARLVGQHAVIDRLTGSLRIDDMPIRSELRWVPRFSLRAGIMTTAEWYRNRAR